ncbi:hypothetical protein C8R44DRAFT_235791 [Mycena epipterygia]|nr:hypothetical protein C8R44DRAFT_235791 [Mycena epipterygia]
MSQENDPVVWANRVMVAAAVIYFYDFFLTLSKEVEYCHSRRYRRPSAYFFLSIRAVSAAYQMIVVTQIARDDWTSQVDCAKWDTVAQSVDTIFQFLSVIGIILRMLALYGYNPLVLIMLLPIGLLGPILNVAVPNPSTFPQCRALRYTASSEIANFVPCIRSIFDMIAAILVLVRTYRDRAVIRLVPGSLIEFFGREAFKDLMQLSGILTIEAICVQIPSVRTNARNFINPFLDSLGAVTFLRFAMELRELTIPMGEAEWSSSEVTLEASQSISEGRPEMKIRTQDELHLEKNHSLCSHM